MYQKFFNRRFQRNTKLLSPPSHDIIARNHSTPKEFGSPVSVDNYEDAEQTLNQDFTGELNFQNLIERLMMIEDVIETERTERLAENSKLTKMIKEMQCKHSAIIYDSEIRYCKSPLKLDVISSLNTEKERTLKKVSSSSYFTEKNNNMIKEKNSSLVSDRINTDKEIKGNTDRNNISRKPSENPENSVKMISYTEIPSLTDRSFFAEREIDNSMILEERIKESFNQNFSKAREESLTVIDKKISQLAQTLFGDYDKINQEIANMKSEKVKLENEIHGLRSNVVDITNKFGEFTKHSDQNSILKNAISESTTQIENKIQEIQRNFKVFEVDVQAELTELFDSTNSFAQEVQRMDEAIKYNSSSLLGKIEDFSSAYLQKFASLQEEGNNKEIDLQKNQNEKILQLNHERETELLNLSQQFEEKLNNRAEILRTTSHKELKSQCEKLEEKLISVIENHVGYVENFIKKIGEKENIIMKKFLSAGDTAESWNEDSNSACSKEKEDKVEELMTIVKLNYDELSSKNSELESTLSGVIEALNDVISKVTTCI